MAGVCTFKSSSFPIPVRRFDSDFLHLCYCFSGGGGGGAVPRLLLMVRILVGQIRLFDERGFGGGEGFLCFGLCNHNEHTAGRTIISFS